MPADAVGDPKASKGATGQKQEVKQMMDKVYGFEAKISDQQQKTIENVMKDKAKAKKYEDEIAKISQDYDMTREKDSATFDKVRFLL